MFIKYLCVGVDSRIYIYIYIHTNTNTYNYMYIQYIDIYIYTYHQSAPFRRIMAHRLQQSEVEDLGTWSCTVITESAIEAVERELKGSSLPALQSCHARGKKGPWKRDIDIEVDVHIDWCFGCLKELQYSYRRVWYGLVLGCGINASFGAGLKYIIFTYFGLVASPRNCRICYFV